MMKKYNFQTLESVPNDLLEYVKNVSGKDFSSVSVDEVNTLLNEVDAYLQWPTQDSGLDG
jgi:hypothetical protein